MYMYLSYPLKFTTEEGKMNETPASVERGAKCAIDFEIYRLQKKTAKSPHFPLR